MKELELKHLAGYLPYGLKASCVRTKEVRTVTLLHFTYDLKTVGHNHLLYKGLLLEQHKPILRPLSDLKKDECFDLYMDFCEEMETISCEYLLESLINKTKYAFDLNKLETLENWMNKNHFDWKYNLIKNNLAIDKNTLSCQH